MVWSSTPTKCRMEPLTPCRVCLTKRTSRQATYALDSSTLPTGVTTVCVVTNGEAMGYLTPVSTKPFQNMVAAVMIDGEKDREQKQTNSYSPAAPTAGDNRGGKRARTAAAASAAPAEDSAETGGGEAGRVHCQVSGVGRMRLK